MIATRKYCVAEEVFLEAVKCFGEGCGLRVGRRNGKGGCLELLRLIRANKTAFLRQGGQRMGRVGRMGRMGRQAGWAVGMGMGRQGLRA